MPLARIAIFAGLSPKQKKSRAKFTECARECRRDAPTKTGYGPCLSACLNNKKSSPRRQRRRKK
jgi:hypothetical protein